MMKGVAVGNEYQFEICNDGNYRNKMADSYGGMVWSGSLWGGGGIDMSWLDGMTGCWGDCPIDSQSVSFSNFKLLDGGDSVELTAGKCSNMFVDHDTPTTTTAAPTTSSSTTRQPGPTTTTGGDHTCPGGNLSGCLALCPDDPPDMFQAGNIINYRDKRDFSILPLPLCIVLTFLEFFNFLFLNKKNANWMTSSPSV